MTSLESSLPGLTPRSLLWQTADRSPHSQGPPWRTQLSEGWGAGARHILFKPIWYLLVCEEKGRDWETLFQPQGSPV